MANAWLPAFGRMGSVSFLIVIVVLAAACSAGNTSTPEGTLTSLPRVMETANFTFYAVPSDRAQVDAVLSAIQERDAEICALLRSECGFPVDIEIYPDQAAFDRQVMNPAYQGFYAISGARRIQMVSPAVAYIAEQYGHDVLNALLRSPDSMEGILQTSRDDFDTGWRHYIDTHCHPAGI